MLLLYYILEMLWHCYWNHPFDYWFVVGYGSLEFSQKVFTILFFQKLGIRK